MYVCMPQAPMEPGVTYRIEGALAKREGPQGRRLMIRIRVLVPRDPAIADYQDAALLVEAEATFAIPYNLHAS